MDRSCGLVLQFAYMLQLEKTVALNKATESQTSTGRTADDAGGRSLEVGCRLATTKQALPRRASVQACIYFACGTSDGAVPS